MEDHVLASYLREIIQLLKVIEQRLKNLEEQ